MIPMSRHSVSLALNERFQTLVELLRPAQVDMEEYSNKLRKLNDILTEVAAGSFAVAIGSLHRRTLIRNSDIDLLWFVPPSVIFGSVGLIPSNLVLKSLHDSLRTLLPDLKLSIDAPAIVIKDTNDRFEINVVPGGVKDLRNLGVELPGALIADRKGGWEISAPRVADDFIFKANEESRGMISFVARFLKFWRQTRTKELPISSFYIEVVLSMSRACSSISFSENVWRSFGALHDCVSGGRGISLGLVDGLMPCRSKSGLCRLESALRNSWGYATKAHIAEEEGNETKAVEYWNRVFGGCFPDYRTTHDNLGWGARRVKNYPGSQNPLPEIFL
jgi:hypothetical protein